MLGKRPKKKKQTNAIQNQIKTMYSLILSFVSLETLPTVKRFTAISTPNGYLVTNPVSI